MKHKIKEIAIIGLIAVASVFIVKWAINRFGANYPSLVKLSNEL